MNHQNQSLPKQAQPSSQQAPAVMQVLNAEEMLAVVGGPEIKNGGIDVTVTPTSVISG